MHKAVIYLHCFRVILDFLYTLSIKLTESCLLAKFIIAICIDAIRIKTKNIAIWNTIGNGVLMEHIAKQCFCHDFVVGVFLENRCTSKTKEQCTWECALNALEHFAEHGTVALIDNKDQAFLANTLNHGSINTWAWLDIRHLLNGCNN